MKKFILMLSLLISSSSCLAIANFNSNTETLVIRDVVVDKNTVYDNVTLKLNLADGTFTVLDATLKEPFFERTSFSDTVLGTFSEKAIKVDFYGCTLSGVNTLSGRNQIICMTEIATTNQNVLVTTDAIIGDRSSPIFDNLGNEYVPSTVIALDMANPGFLRFPLIQDIPVEVKFIYDNINPSATSISLFEPLFSLFSNNDPFLGSVQGSFTDIDFCPITLTHCLRPGR